MAYTTIKKPSDYFNTKLTTGTGNSQAVTGVGFQPDWIWGKRRDSSGNNSLFDAVRGITKGLESNNTSAEFTSTGYYSSFDSDGFTIAAGAGGAGNGSGQTAVQWCWKANGSGSANTDGTINSTVSANTTSGFSIVKYTGTGANATVGHGLGAVPKMMIFKELGGTNGWHVYHEFLGNNKVSLLDNVAQGYYSPNSFLNTTDPTSSLIYLGDNAGSNSTNGTIAYCFAEKTGFSKISSYTGNGNADGTFVYTGFKPAWVLIRRTDAGGHYWHMYDTKRSSSGGSNIIDDVLYPNENFAEYSGDKLDILSNGIKFKSSNGDINASGGSYIYMAFAEQPLIGDNPATAR